MEVFVLPAMLLLLSVLLRKCIVNSNGTLTMLSDIIFGIPVDLTFVAFAITFSLQINDEYWVTHQNWLIVGLLLIAVIQLAVIYKPGKEYIDESKNWRSFFLWFLNAVITFCVFSFLILKVVK